MKFALFSKITPSVIACVLLVGCGQVGSTSSEYVSAKITNGTSNQRIVEIAVPEVTQSSNVSQPSDVVPAPELVIPGEVSQLPTKARQKGLLDETSTLSHCDGVDGSIASHFEGLLKCDQLNEVVAYVREQLNMQDAEKLLFALMMEWKNEHCIAPAEVDENPIYPLKEEEGPTHKNPIIKGKLPDVDADNLVYKREYVPCRIGDDSVVPVK